MARRMKSRRNIIAAATMLAVLVMASLSCGEDNAADSSGSEGSIKTGGAANDSASVRARRLEAVETWFYYLAVDPDGGILQKVADSSYDMVVIDPVFTEAENPDFDMAAVVRELHGAAEPRLVIAYIDIGQAEEWRTYWQREWAIGNPDWIVATDPDGWEGNYPVAFWREEWQEIWLGGDGYLQGLIDAGFDGVYLDWVEAYSDEDVLEAAETDGVDARAEMVTWVSRIAAYGRGQDDGFIVIAQNAAELAGDEEYAMVIDAIAQEQVWFDGGADSEPPGDCPLPRADADIDSAAYIESLSPECRKSYESFPESTLHTSSEEYITYLQAAQSKGLVIFTVDYALAPENISLACLESRRLGFVPYAGERDLGTFREPIA